MKAAPPSNNRRQRRVNHFARFNATVMAMNEAAKNKDLAAMQAAASAYRSRGKGRGTPSRVYGNPAGRYMPHQGAQERLRRQVGGWPATGMTKAKFLYGTTLEL